MLRDLRARSRGNDGSERGDIERSATVTAGATGIDEIVPIHIERRDARTHRLGRTRDLFRRLALHAQCDEQRGLLNIGRAAVHDLAEHVAHFVASEVVAVDYAFDCIGDHEWPPALLVAGCSLLAVARRKFMISWSPPEVPKDSG